MIRWCCYCQRFLNELAPYDRPDFTHSICTPCEEKLERGEAVLEDTELVRGLVTRILNSARNGDEAAFAAILPEARARGLAPESVLLGMLQPALYQAGLDWQNNSMSVAAEQRLSSWCERVFGMLEPSPRVASPVDLLIFQVPGNTHTIGPRFAAHVLRAQGVSVEAIVPALPVAEMVRLARQHRPDAIGFSCAIYLQVPVATELVARLRDELEPELCCRYVLSGLAFRFAGTAVAPEVAPGVEVLLDPLAFRAQHRRHAPA